MIETATHNGQTCIFEEEGHLYTVNGKRLVSGTTFIKQFLPKFDGFAVAEKTAKKRNTTTEALLREWKEKGERASKKGTAVHNYARWMFDPNSDPERPPYSIEADRVGFLTVQLLKACDKLQDKGLQPIEPEMIVFSPDLGVAGMIDLLLWGPHKKWLGILDWKTNEELTVNNPFQECLSPINHLEDANLVHHSLQLSLYQYILITENYYPDVEEYKRIIVHLTEQDNSLYFCKYLENEIESLLI